MKGDGVMGKAKDGRILNNGFALDSDQNEVSVVDKIKSMTDELLSIDGLIAVTNGLIADLIDALEIIQDLEGTIHSNIIIEYMHNLVHKGLLFTVSKTKNCAKDTGTFALRVKGVAGKEMHVRINYSTEAKTTFKSYVNTTYSGNGTEIVPFNRLTTSANVLAGKVYQDPTVNVLGVQRGDESCGTNGTQTRAGGVGGSDIESIITGTDDLLLIWTNTDGSARDITVTLNIYEITEGA